jgi:hypothetical protein
MPTRVFFIAAEPLSGLEKFGATQECFRIALVRSCGYPPRMRKIFIVVAWIGVAILVAFNITLIWGSRLPKDHVITRTMVLHQPQQQIWQTITDFPHELAWRTDLKSVERLADKDGRQVWRENYKRMGSETLETEQFVPPGYVVRTIVDPGGPVQGSWEYSLQNAGSMTVVQITERGHVRNPFYRFMSAKIFHYNWIDDYLKMLARHFGENPPIR